jgi:lipoprotein NlpD
MLATLAAVLAGCSTPPPPPPPTTPRPPVTQAPPPPPPVAAPAPRAMFLRPASGPTVQRFDGKTNKGLDIAGKAGDAIIASADGRVVYVGSELRGYGNMIIVRHDETFLTAYAHARTILVKEKDVVRQGQTIAEMGSSDADRVKVHFEIRKQGVAVDPEPYLAGALP